jgi:uncharacterized protein YjbJ (UPF0337 family)
MSRLLEWAKLRGFPARCYETARGMVMDRNRVVGSVKEAKGAVKEAVGTAIGDAKLQADGRADKVEGKTQNAIGGAMDTVRNALKK